MSTIGFCLITNVEGHNEDSLLEAIKAYHNLQLNVKLGMAPKHISPQNQNLYQGYFPFLENDVALKEFYSMPRPFDDISKWEAEGCKMYEPVEWKGGDEYKWIFDRFRQHF